MKALSLIQPWASLCVMTDENGKAHKQFETRDWKPSAKMWREIKNHTIAIHAAKGFPASAKKYSHKNPFVRPCFNSEWFEFTDQFTLGAITGTVEISGIYRIVNSDNVPLHLYRAEIEYAPVSTIENLTEKEIAFGDYSHGRYAWKLENPRLLPNPIECKGALSLWNVPENIEREINLIFGE